MTPDPTLIEQAKRLLDIWDAAPRGAITYEQGAAHNELCNMGPELARALLTLQGSAALPSEGMIEAGMNKLHDTIDLSDELLADLADDMPRVVEAVYLAMRATTPTAPDQQGDAR